jgi:hypothetical protein
MSDAVFFAMAGLLAAGEAAAAPTPVLPRAPPLSQPAAAIQLKGAL